MSEVPGAGGPAGLVVLGAGSIPLARIADRRSLVDAAAAAIPGALANQRYSADVLAIARADLALADLPVELDSDNALPRWLAERAGVEVRDLRARRRLAMDVDSPLDLLLLEAAAGAPPLPLPGHEAATAVRDRLATLRNLAGDPGAELLVAGRMSSADLRWMERSTRSRTPSVDRGARPADGDRRGAGGALEPAAAEQRARRAAGPRRTRLARPAPRLDGGRRDRRHEGPARAPAGRRRWRLADGRGPVRKRPAAG